MKNLGQMMKQAQQMQQRMQDMQQQLESIEIEGASAGGMVKVTLSGKGVMKRLSIDKSLVNPQEIEMMEDLVIAAHNDAKAKMEAHVQEKMSELTGGLSLPPGMSLPF